GDNAASPPTRRPKVCWWSRRRQAARPSLLTEAPWRSDLFLGVFPELGARHLPPMHGVRPIGEPQRSEMGPRAGERRILADALRAVHLHSLVRHLERDAWRDHLDLADPGRGGARITLVDHPRRLEAEQPGHLDLHPAFGDDV